MRTVFINAATALSPAAAVTALSSPTAASSVTPSADAIDADYFFTAVMSSIVLSSPTAAV